MKKIYCKLFGHNEYVSGYTIKGCGETTTLTCKRCGKERTLRFIDHTKLNAMVDSFALHLTPPAINKL